MRFDINRSGSYVFVDDVYQAVNTSGLPPNVVRVKWLDDEGYVYFTDATLNQKIVDPSPYQSFLNLWATARITATPPLGLADAKQIKLYLIGGLYDLKRQLPYHQAIAAGDFSWEANDGAVASMAAAGLPALYQATVAENGGLSTWIADLNAQISAGIVAVGNDLVSFINYTVLGSLGDSQNTLNNKLRSEPIDQVAKPGLNADIALAAVTFYGPGGAPPASINGTLSLIPIGGTVPVSLTLAEFMNLMQGIATRRSTLLATRGTKLAQVNALTTIASVIAYDATAGW